MSFSQGEDTSVRAGTDESTADGAIHIDPVAMQVFVGDQEVLLTRTEFRLLHLLMMHRRTVLTYHRILTLLWGEWYSGNEHIHVHVHHIRGKPRAHGASDKAIATVRGVGYRFDGP